MARSDNSAKGCKVYGRRLPGFKKNYRVPRSRQERHVAKAVIRRGDELALSRHRHSALWEYF
jgi:hypothetical protein